MAGFTRIARVPLQLVHAIGNLFNPLAWQRRGWFAGGLTILCALLVLILVVGWWWGHPPATFDPDEQAQVMADASDEEAVTGYVTTAALIHSTQVLLNKPGGYLYNDVLPPGVMMDNVPAFEYGAVVQLRDLAGAMRNEMSRSQSQSHEDEDLAQAEPRLNFNANAWMFPSTEGQYDDALDYLRDYRQRLARGDANFYARADNLRAYLQTVSQRLGSIVERLSASVGETRANLDLAGEPSGKSAHPGASEVREQTPWMQVDNEFYHARGATWALLAFVRAIRTDFSSVLEDKNATASLDHAIQSLQAAQRPLSSPIVLNGGGFGMTANHSLVMASYISRANSSLIDLRQLLSQG